MLHVIVASDLQVVRESLVRTLNQFGDLCATSCLALASVVNAEPQLKTLQAILWVTKGHWRAAELDIGKLHHAPRTIVLCLEPGVARSARAEDRAGRCVLDADVSVEELRATVYRRATDRASNGSKASSDEDPELPGVASLTRREREVLRLIAQGLSNKEIATSLDLSIFTAKNHVQRLMNKLELHSRSAVIARYGRSLDDGDASGT